MMQYYRIGETLEPLESLPPEEKSILAVLCPEELPGALLPQGLTPPQPPEDLRENQYCWLHIRQGALAGEVRLPQRGAQSVRRLAFALAGESLLLVDHNGYAAECLKQLTLPTGHALTADELLAELLTALTQNDLPMLQGLESRLTTLEQGVLADDTDKFIHKMSAIRRELNRENRFYARWGILPRRCRRMPPSCWGIGPSAGWDILPGGWAPCAAKRRCCGNMLPRSAGNTRRRWISCRTG